VSTTLDANTHSRGEYALADGSHFEGIFVQDRKHGPGVLRTADGQQLQQEWRDGKLVWELPLHAGTCYTYYLLLTVELILHSIHDSAHITCTKSYSTASIQHAFCAPMDDGR
jgi:MORN repeat